MNVSASLTLNGDLQCSGTNGLTITGNSVILNLNGHMIVGDGTSAYNGIVVNGNKDTIENGVVTEFGVGLVVYGATSIVTKVHSSYNVYDGIYVVGDGGKYTSNILTANGYAGIYGYGSSVTLTSNHALSNHTVGINMALSVSPVLTSNIANGNGQIGIQDGSYGMKLTTNTANFNGSDGIYVNDATVIDGGGNLAKGNNTTAAPAEECYGIVCS